MLDQNGETVWQASYDPFGAAIISPDSTITNNLRLPGQYFDSETGFHYNWHRYYEPGLGRYLRPDPIGLDGGINLYAYVGGNPVNAIDPIGLTSAIVAMRWVPMAVPFAFAIAGVGSGLVMVGGAAVIVLATPTELGDGTIPDTDWPKENEECKPKQCKPCNPPVGTIATDVHHVPPRKPHYPIEGSHVHWFKMNQSPYPACKCIWNRNYQKPTPGNTTPPGTVPVAPATGGGPM